MSPLSAGARPAPAPWRAATVRRHSRRSLAHAGVTPAFAPAPRSSRRRARLYSRADSGAPRSPRVGERGAEGGWPRQRPRATGAGRRTDGPGRRRRRGARREAQRPYAHLPAPAGWGGPPLPAWPRLAASTPIGSGRALARAPHPCWARGRLRAAILATPRPTAHRLGRERRSSILAAASGHPRVGRAPTHPPPLRRGVPLRGRSVGRACAAPGAAAPPPPRRPPAPSLRPPLFDRAFRRQREASGAGGGRQASTLLLARHPPPFGQPTFSTRPGPSVRGAPRSPLRTRNPGAGGTTVGRRFRVEHPPHSPSRRHPPHWPAPTA